MPKVSVIIPCYNLGNYLDEAVDSVLKQVVQDFEIIIINDGSTDEYTINKLRSFSKPKCRVVHTINRGLAAARNEGLRYATGDYIQFLDADDVIDQWKFELQLEQLEKTPNLALSTCDYFASSESNLNEEITSRYLSPRFKTTKYIKELILDWENKLSIPCHSFMFQSRIFKEFNIQFDETLPNHEDWDCWLSIFALNPEVYYIDKKLATYRIRSKAMSYDSALMKSGFLKVIEKQKENKDRTKEEYLFFTIKQNQILYGFASKQAIISMLMGFAIKIRRKIIKLTSLIYRLFIKHNNKFKIEKRIEN